MRIDERFLDELKSRLRPSDVIGKTVALKRQGREWAGLSPFTKEKSPSFFVNDDKGFYHCFSSGKHGDIISFLQETERLSFMEAVERLAGQAGLALPAADPQAEAAQKKRQSLTDWMEQAAKYFEAALKRPEGKAARSYLLRRGLTEADLVRFRIGYSPSGRTALKDALIQRGGHVQDLVAAGLLIAPEDASAPYDRFRDRIMFPILDARGRIVSFGGRALDPEAKAKYLNGPETELFHKGATLYGLPEALRIIGQAPDHPPLVVVEGYMDVIACQKANIPAVAPLGTALTEEQIEALWRRTPEPVLCFDGDGAGLRAAYRALDRALPLLKPGRSFRLALLAGGQDPDDILRDKGPAALAEAIAATQPFVDVLFRREQELETLDTPERRAGFKQRLRSLAGTIQDKDLADAYRAELLSRADALAPKSEPAPQGFRRSWRDPKLPEPARPESKVAAAALSVSLDPFEAAIVAGALRLPDAVDAALEDLEAPGLFREPLQNLVREIISWRLAARGLDMEPFARHLAAQGLSAALTDMQKAAQKCGAPFLDPDADVVVAKDLWLRAFSALQRLMACEAALASAKREAEDRFDVNAFGKVKLERDRIKRAIRSGSIWTDDAL